MVALRSIFRALKQERLIFASPCAGISVTRSPALPAGLPQDRVAGLLDRAPGQMARFALALVAIHALRPDELRAAELADLDLTRARLTVRRTARPHVIYLDEMTLGCADAWVRDRPGRDHPRPAARGPDPRRGPPHRRSGSADAPVRHLRRHGDEVRLHRAPGASVRPTAMTRRASGHSGACRCGRWSQERVRVAVRQA
jgi:integrase